MRPRAVVAPAAVAAVVGAALLLGIDHRPGPGSAPGSDAGPPGSTSTAPSIVTPEEFCAGFAALADAQNALFEASSPDAVADLRSAATGLRELTSGTAMPADAVAGVDYLVSAFIGLPDDATAQDVVESDDLATVTDQARADALAAYISASCGSSPLSTAR